MKYLYIFEDGEMTQTDTEPTPQDILSVDVGVLVVVTVRDGQFREYNDGGRTDVI